MNRINFDWRWIALIVIVVIIAGGARMPWPITVLVLGGGGAYLLNMGWQAWTRAGGAPSKSKVTYWRGQRIEVGPPRRGPAMPRLSDIGPAVVPLLIGGVMALAALSILLQRIGM